LEVAEHLPETVGQRLVSELTRIAPAVLFSAAIPGQGGTGHINEQWQDYWAKSFADHAFVSLDCIRPVVWTNQRVDYWYAQNCLLMISRDVLSASKTLNNIVNNALPLPVVHPVALRHSQAEIARLKNPGVLGWLAGGPRALNGTLRRRLRTTAQHNP
jgi:hypothetical protein